MKRLICLGLAMICLLCGCTKAPSVSQPYVVTTNFPAYDFARQILGGQGQVELLIPLGGEAHGYEPTLQDLAIIQSCDVVIYNGGESDAFMDPLLAGCDLSRKTVIRMMDHVELLTAGEAHHQHEHNHTHREADEHIWTTPQNALLIAQAIGEGLQQASPTNGQLYKANFKDLQERLQQLQADYDVLEKAEKKPLLVADRFPFTYLAHQYNLTYYAAFSGCTSNTEVGLKAMADLLEIGCSHQVQTVLYTEFSQGDLAQKVANGLGGKTAVWHSCHNVSKQDFEQGITYEQFMMNNLAVLKEALYNETD